MKKLLLTIILFCIGTMMSLYAEVLNPKANNKAIVISGNVRLTVLTPEMIRIEYSDKGIFEDRATFAVVNRYLDVPRYSASEKDGYLYIRTTALLLKYRKGASLITDPEALTITMLDPKFSVTWHPGVKDMCNLKGTCRTLDSQDGDNKRSEMEDGVISRSGWAVIDDSYDTKRSDGSKSLILEPTDDGVDWVSQRKDAESKDWYFMGYGHDYKCALKDFTRISGNIPMPPLYAMGYWYSKYQKYNEQDFKELVVEMETNDVPLDVMVVDTDWHINGWTGWSWNKNLFPNPKNFLDWLHKHNLKVTLNLHPAYGVEKNEDNYSKFTRDLGLCDTIKSVPWNLENRDFYHSLFKNIIKLRQDEGVDFWWLDWQQWLLSDKVDGLGHTFWCNHVFYEDMRNNRPDHRPLIFHRWGGLGSHRYQLGFSGDSHSNFATLAFQPYFTATASNVGYGYWGHDLGGHVQPGENNPELFLRWIQFGVFSPILRTHSTNASNIERRMWKYPNFADMRKAVQLRYALVPYIYTMAYKTYDTGISICRPLYYDYPEEDNSYKFEGEYMFGDDILVAPVVEAAKNGISKKNIWLPEGKWYEAETGTMFEGGQNVEREFTASQIPYYFKAGSIIPNYPKMNNLKSRPNELIIKFIPGTTGKGVLYEDENDNENYKNKAYTITNFYQKRSDRKIELSISARYGSFNGMPEKRDYELIVLGIDRIPSKIAINGKAFTEETSENVNWIYDNNTKQINIKLKNINCSSSTKIRLNF